MGTLRPRKISEVLALIWRRKAIILLITTAMLLATLLVVKSLPDAFESRGLVIVAAPAEASPVVTAQITATTQQLSSQSQLAALVRKYPLYPALATTDEAITVLRKALKSEIKQRGYYPDGPESFTISYRHTDPWLAQQVIKEQVEIFEQSNEITKKRAAQEAEEVKQELVEVEARLQESLAKAKAEEEAASGSKTVLDSVAVNTQRMTTAAAIESLKDRQFGLEQQITTLKKQIADQQKLVKQTAPPNPTQSAQGPLLLRRAELQAKLKEYATQYTEKNPKVIQTRTELSEVNRQLATLTTSNDVDPTTVASLEAQELRTHQRELARAETELEVTRRDLERKQQFMAELPAVDPTSAFTRTEPLLGKGVTGSLGTAVYANWSDRYKTLLMRRDALQKVLTSGGVFQVLDRPPVSQNPVGPNRTLLKLLGLALGLFSGLAVAFALEAPQMFRIQDERDVDYFLGAPVLALIPETLTAAESNRTQRLLLARRLLILALAAGLVPVFYLLLKSVGIFQFLGYR